MCAVRNMNDDRIPLPKKFKLVEPGGITYVIDRVLSISGGFGITYLATKHYFGNKKQVVLKENYPKNSAERLAQSYQIKPYPRSKGFFDSTLDKFKREAQILHHLSHDNIVKVDTVFDALGTAYYCMPYLEGAKELWKAAPPTTKMTEKWLLGVLCPLLQGVGHIHKHKLLHRDIKTSNILLDSDNKPVLIDFGIAREVYKGPTTSLQYGTLGFSPPEQGSSEATCSADIYSLGATCYALITGTNPPSYQKRITNPELCTNLSSKPELKKRYSRKLLDSIEKAMKLAPGDRWQSTESWLKAIGSDDDDNKGKGIKRKGGENGKSERELSAWAKLLNEVCKMGSYGAVSGAAIGATLGYYDQGWDGVAFGTLVGIICLAVAGICVAVMCSLLDEH